MWNHFSAVCRVAEPLEKQRHLHHFIASPSSLLLLQVFDVDEREGKEMARSFCNALEILTGSFWNFFFLSPRGWVREESSYPCCGGSEICMAPLGGRYADNVNCNYALITGIWAWTQNNESSIWHHLANGQLLLIVSVFEAIATMQSWRMWLSEVQNMYNAVGERVYSYALLASFFYFLYKPVL